MRQTILVVDDEPDILELIRLNLSQAGYRIETAMTGSEALGLLERSAPDLVVLDLMLPDMSGTEVCRQIRNRPRSSAIPVVMLTAKGEEIDRVIGFEVGADDYVTKPFSPRELLLRVEAILRRTLRANPSRPSLLQHGDLKVDLERHRCRHGEQEITLTAKEFGLLVALMSRPGRVMTREQLLDEVWDSDVSVTQRTIDTHLKRLREKLGDQNSLIDTIRGVGYRFAEEPQP